MTFPDLLKILLKFDETSPFRDRVAKLRGPSEGLEGKSWARSKHSAASRRMRVRVRRFLRIQSIQVPRTKANTRKVAMKANIRKAAMKANTRKTAMKAYTLSRRSIRFTFWIQKWVVFWIIGALMEFQIVAMLFQGICAQFLAIFPNFGQFDAIQFQAIWGNFLQFEAISGNFFVARSWALNFVAKNWIR